MEVRSNADCNREDHIRQTECIRIQLKYLPTPTPLRSNVVNSRGVGEAYDCGQSFAKRHDTYVPLERRLAS